MLIIPYILPMLLGRTYDYNKAHVGVDIFDRSVIQSNTRKIDRYVTDAQFRMIQSTHDVDDVLDVSGELSLKVLADVVNVDGMGSYLKDKHDKESVVEVLCHVKYETVTETLRTEASPKSGWNRFSSSVLGSHFVRSLTYGGELVASLKFRAKDKKDVQKIEAKISASVGIQGTLDLGVGGEFKKIQKELGSSVNLEIKYYATVPVANVAQDLTGLQSLITDFPKHVAKVGKGQGNPIRAELYPLDSFRGSNLPAFIRSNAITARINEVSEKYDDVLTAQRELKAWLNDLQSGLDASLMQQIGALNSELTDVGNSFYRAIVRMDITSNGKTTQFDECLRKYKGSSSFVLPGKYMRKFRDLKRRVEAALSKVRPCDFSTPLLNAGVLRANVLNTGKSRRVSGAMNVERCQQKCLEDARCNSITYYRKKGSDGKKLTTADRCYINYVTIADDRLVPVPHRGDNDILIYVRNRKDC